MLEFENNPIVAAFAFTQLYLKGLSTPSVEWDVYTDHAAIARWMALSQCTTSISENCLCPTCAALLRVVDTAIIAHGGLGALLLEKLGLPGAYSCIQRTPVHKLGGVFLPEWLNIFYEALQLGSPSVTPSAIVPELRVVLDIKTSAVEYVLLFTFIMCLFVRCCNRHNHNLILITHTDQCSGQRLHASCHAVA